MDSSSDDDNEGEDQEKMEIDEASSTSGPSQDSRVKSARPLMPPARAPNSDKDEDGSEGEETWGTKKSSYYSANDAHFDPEDEEANELEDKEARRLQTKAREGMDDEDFGLDNLRVLIEDGRMEPDVTEYISFCSFARLESLIVLCHRGLVGDLVAFPSIPQDKLSLLRHLEKNSPETLALARDWDDIAVTVAKAGQRLKKFVALFIFPDQA